jgi:hypothetical protein
VDIRRRIKRLPESGFFLIQRHHRREVEMPGKKPFEALILVSCLGLTAFVCMSNDATVNWLTAEDGIVEWSTALAFAAAALTCLWYARSQPQKPLRRCYLILWAMLAFVFLGEETSWFQRQLHFDTPEFLAQNVQGETNLHNLPALTPKVVAGPTDLITSQGGFYIGFGLYFLCFPSVLQIGPLRRFAQAIAWPKVSPRFLLGVWLPIITTFVLATLISHGPSRDGLTELREMFFAIAIYLYCTLLPLLPSVSAGVTSVAGPTELPSNVQAIS